MNYGGFEMQSEFIVATNASQLQTCIAYPVVEKGLPSASMQSSRGDTLALSLFCDERHESSYFELLQAG
jgi:hypothetical protein